MTRSLIYSASQRVRRALWAMVRPLGPQAHRYVGCAPRRPNASWRARLENTAGRSEAAEIGTHRNLVRSVVGTDNHIGLRPRAARPADEIGCRSPSVRCRETLGFCG